MSYFTIEERIRSRDNHFTLIRLLASYAVLFAHSFALSTGQAGKDPITKAIYVWWKQGLGTVAVVIFFIISGFLVSASYIHRNNLFAFAEARFLRIFPALFFAVIFCAFIVGPWVTILPLGDYLYHSDTWSFVLHNITLFDGIHFRLPGVFLENPWSGGVNGSLWTLPIELYMYCMVMLMGVLGVFKYRILFNAVTVLLCFSLLALQQGWINVNIVFVKHAGLVMAYIAGIFFYVNREFIPLNMAMLTLTVAAIFLSHETMAWPIVQVFGFAYIVLFVSLHPAVKLPNIDKWGDYSYGLYIYAFPVQQLVVKYITISPIKLFIYSTLITFPLAILSWKYIESPVLKLKGKMPFGKRWLDPRVRVRDKGKGADGEY